MTVAELIAELQGYPPDWPIILHASDTLGYGNVYTVIEPAVGVRIDNYSGETAVYVTDGSY